MALPREMGPEAVGRITSQPHDRTIAIRKILRVTTHPSLGYVAAGRSMMTCIANASNHRVLSLKKTYPPRRFDKPVSEELAGPSGSEEKEAEQTYTFICRIYKPKTDAISVAELMKRNHRDPQKTPSKPGMHRRVPDDDL